MAGFPKGKGDANRSKKPRPKPFNPEKTNPSHRVLAAPGGAAWPALLAPLACFLCTSHREPLTQDPLPYLHPSRRGPISLLSVGLGPHLAMGPHKSKHQPTVPTDLKVHCLNLA